MAFQDAVVHGLPLSHDSFTNPPLEMGIIPFWFWNGELDYDEMAWQLRQYHEKGVRSIFIHGRMGLKVPYLSDGWFDRVKFAVQEAKKLGIDTWIYDEMDWPSGTAERQVLKEFPHLSQRYLDLVALHIDGPLFTFLEAHDSRYVNTGPASPVAAYGVRTEQFHDGIQETIDLNKNLSFERTIPWEAPEGKWTLMYFLEKEAPWYIDTLNPESTERFIELTHEKYKAAVGDEFGKTVPGFYTDEPAMYYFQVGLQNHVVPWSRQMFKIFRERRGYDLKPYLPALYTQMGEVTAQVRYDYYQTLTEQYEETYYKRIADWCHENGTLFTGHLLFEELLRLQARCEGNLFRYLRHMDVIGVDHLYPKIGSPEEPAEHVALKIGSSAAHHFGSTRLLCESMGGTYWDCTLERMKWMANWEYVLGVNLFNNHGYHYSIEGERKRDWPPSQFYHHTWWEHYPQFTDYMARLSHLLSGGRHVAKVLMLYPITSIWTNFVPQHQDEVSRVIERDFNHITDALLRLHYDFDYVDEDVLAEATVKDGKIHIRDEEFEVLILPPLTHIKRSTFEKMEALVAGGGSVIADTLMPLHFIEAGSTAPVARNGASTDLSSFFGLDTPALHDRFVAEDAGSFAVKYGTGSNGKGNIISLIGAGLDGPDGVISSEAKDGLKSALEECITPDVTVSEPDVFYLHRVKDDFDIFFLVNTKQEKREGVEVTLERTGRPELWNPNSGETTPIDLYEVRDGRLVVWLDFPPSEAHVVVVRNGDGPHATDSNLDSLCIEGSVVRGFSAGAEEVFAVVDGERLSTPARKPLDPISFPETFSFETQEDNILLISDWKMNAVDGEESTSGFEKPDFDDSAWLDVTNGAWEMQLPQERDEATYPVTVEYRTSFEVRHLPSNPRILIDGFRGKSYRLYLNGNEITDPGTRCWLDAEIKEVPISDYLIEGRNVVALQIVATKRTDGLLDLLKVVGNFALENVGDGAYAIGQPQTQMKVGDWTQHGLPFFSGTGIYRCEVEVPEAYLGGRMTLEANVGEDVLEVLVNGSEGRVAPWHPYRLDLTDLLRAGTNTIELRVTNTLINLLEGVSLKSGLLDQPHIRHEHSYELPL
ncbi:hypothetical protein BH23BAC4_BH23BAC4_00850 [soil metagenome]